jgi:lantibiotic modifying enzyme
MLKKIKQKLPLKIGHWVDFDPKHIQVTREFIKDKTSETHNGCKVVLIFNILDTVKKNNFKVVYKPRKAFTDALVIELFNQVNIKLPKMPQFFIYKILNYQDREVSYWEYVEGKKKSKRIIWRVLL